MSITAHKKILAKIGQAAAEHNLKAWAVGGFVRDLHLGKATEDIDICVEGSPSALIDFCVREYGASALYFNDFGTARVTLANGLKLDFVRCRKEVYKKPAALPVVSPSDLSDDLFRRDFTCNAWALSLLPKEFLKSYDLYGSQKAIDGKYIEVLHHASFVDDPTRLFRAVRFAARFDWRLGANTQKLLKQAVAENLPNLLSRERISHELIKILEEKDSFSALSLLKKYKLLAFVSANLKIIPSNINKAATARQKLALLALGVDEQEEFLKSLHLQRQDFLALKNLCDIYNSPLAPLRALTAEEKEVIKLFNPSAVAALKPCVVSGGELSSLGLKGAAINKALTFVATAQRAGKIKTKAAALKLLKQNNLI